MSQHNNELEKKDLGQLCSDIVSKGKCIRLIARGNSMHPFIKDEEIIIINPVEIFKIMKGDIIFYNSAKGMIAHRVIEKRKTNDKIVLVTKGDSNFDCDPPCGEKNLVGKVIEIEKINIKINMDCRLLRATNYLIAEYSSLSFLIYKIIRLLKIVFMADRDNAYGYIKILFLPLNFSQKLLINFLLAKQHIRFKQRIDMNLHRLRSCSTEGCGYETCAEG